MILQLQCQAAEENENKVAVTLAKVHKWFNYKLSINRKKTNFIVFGSQYHCSRMSNVSINLNNVDIQNVSKAKQLGIDSIPMLQGTCYIYKV